MTTWNYRVVRTQHGNEDVLFSIHEVYYSERGEHRTDNPIPVISGTREGLRGVLGRMLEALDKPDFVDQ